MKAYCPSNGLCGLDHIELPQVKIDMLRSVPDLPEDDVNRKNSFLALVVGDREFLRQITPEDRDYFFVISAASISANALPFSVECSCGCATHGSIELAPVLNLCDVIVDIVETGKTLRDNNLEVIETIAEISARVIANKTSYKFNYEAINKICDDLSGV